MVSESDGIAGYYMSLTNIHKNAILSNTVLLMKPV